MIKMRLEDNQDQRNTDMCTCVVVKKRCSSDEKTTEI